MPTTIPPPAFDLDAVDLEGFARDIKALRAEALDALGPADLRHLRRIERWGRIATAIGLATAPIAPNPLSAAALALGRATRWLLMHHIGHRGYDRVPGVAPRHTSRVFARGWRRLVDWADWMIPSAWIYEHNVLHHQNTGERRDPDLIEENVADVHQSGLPIGLRYALLGVLGATWRASYYAPKTLRAWWHRHAAAGAPTPTPRGVLLRQCYAPYALLNFVALPLLFAPLGAWAVFSAWCNSLLADVFTNLHTFFVVGPNHSGDDVYRFDGRPTSRGEFYVRQVVGSVNYRTGGDVTDYAHLWLNYQIEHHLFPDLPMLAYRRVQPKVEAICVRYGIPYLQQPVGQRFAKMARIFAGTARMPWLDAATAPSRDPLPEPSMRTLTIADALLASD
ncbi:MAG TPA: fatty acid desaturase [Candidatus Binatia bacterium]|nr:fatty acid desaturase [Candidatus Binatia bacterium]